MKLSSTAIVAILATYGTAFAGTDYFFTTSTPVIDISDKTIFNANYYNPNNYNKLIWSVDNPDGDPNGLPANQPGTPIDGWNLGDFTGLNVPTPYYLYQRGKPTTSYGGTAVSMHDVMDGGILSPRYGAMLNAFGNLPWTQLTDGNGTPLFGSNGKPLSHPSTIMGANLAYAFSTDIDHRPFGRGPTSVFNFSMQIQAPSVYVVGDARAHFGPSFTLEDRTDPNQRYVWFGVWAFDAPSGDQNPAPLEGISWDIATSSYIVGSSFNNNTTYSTVNPGSSLSTNTPWSGWKYYSFSVSYNQVKKVINDLNSVIANNDDCKTSFVGVCRRFSENPEDYKLGLVHLDAEIARTSPSSAGYLGFSTYGWWVFTDY